MSNTMDKILDTADKVLSVTEKTAVKVFNQSRSKAEQAAQHAKLAKLHRQLGALVYALEKSGETNDSQIQWYISEIDKVHKALKRSESTSIKNSFVVVNTGSTPSEGKEDAMFCGGDEQ